MEELELSQEQMATLTNMYNFMTQHRGLSSEAASAILGNVMQESSFNHNAVSNKGAKGVYQLLGQNQSNYDKYLDNKKWDDGPLSQTSFVLNEIQNGRDYYYETYDRLKERQANGWKERTADGKGWYKNLNDSIYFTEKYLPREQAGTMPPRREEMVKVLDTSTSIPEITEMFMNYWERPSASEANLPKRIEYSNIFYKYFTPKKQQGGKLNYLNYFK